MNRIYIAGPMTGLKYLNFPAFFGVATAMRGQGYEVINPAELNRDELDWHQCLRRDIAALVTCNAIYLLRGWENSRGATLEHHIAERLGLEVIFQPALILETQNA